MNQLVFINQQLDLFWRHVAHSLFAHSRLACRRQGEPTIQPRVFPTGAVNKFNGSVENGQGLNGGLVNRAVSNDNHSQQAVLA